MYKLLFISLTLLTFFASNAQSKKVPFFGKMTYSEICGSGSDCLPTNGTKANIAGKIYYNGDPNSFLGMKFKKSPFPPLAIGFKNITAVDLDTFVVHNGSAKIDVQQKKDFDAKISGDLKQIINSSTEIGDDLKAKILVEIDNEVKKETSKTIDFHFEIIQLKNTGSVGTEITNKLATLNKGEKLIVGISVMTISGSWTSKTLKTILDNFELTAGYKELSADAKLKFQQAKDRALKGTVKPFSFIIGDTYLIKQ